MHAMDTNLRCRHARRMGTSRSSCAIFAGSFALAVTCASHVHSGFAFSTIASAAARTRIDSYHDRGPVALAKQSDFARRRDPGVAVGALDLEGFASFASFSVITGAPIPLAMSALFRRAEIVEAERGESVLPPTPAPATSEKDTAMGEPLDLMWAFPSFAVFLENPSAAAPVGFPMWGRWLCLAAFWPGVIWYLWYKLVVEEDLRQYRGLGIGGYLVIVPFAVGLFLGVFGEFAYGSLEGGPLDNPFSVAFYSGFAWIYLNQWLLYNKVNQLFEEEGRPAPLDPFGLFVPGWNFVTGIRQIHFTADYWARQRGQQLPRDAFAELFPFAAKPTLSLFEFATTPALWFDIGKVLG